MGIDVYASWAGQTEEEREAQFTGFSTVHGQVGYLHEAYHGGPYSTKILVPEAFDYPEDWDYEEDGEWPGAAIEAKVMRDRLPEAVFAKLIRNAEVYGDSVSREILCILGVEPRLADGSDPAEIDANEVGTDGLMDTIIRALDEAKDVGDRESEYFEYEMPEALLYEEIMERVAEKVGNVKSLVDFVDLCEDKERETGEPINVVASY